MKKLFKRLTAVLIAVSVIVSLVPFVFAGAEDAERRIYEGVCGEELRTNVTWRLDTSTGELVISGTGRMQENVVSPWHGLGVKTVVINSGVTGIGINAFSGCREIESVTIADTVTEIGDSAFNYCKSLEEIVIPDSVEIIGNDVFKSCVSLKSIKLSASLSSVGTGITSGCENLTSVTVSAENEHFCIDESFVLYNKDKTVLIDSLCKNSIVNYTVPEGVESTAPVAFSQTTTLETLSLPASLRTLGRSSFSSCGNLKSVTFAENSNLKTVESVAFYSCHNLSNMRLPAGIEYIGEYFAENTAYRESTCNDVNGVLYDGEYLIDVDYSFRGNLEVKEGTRLIANGALTLSPLEGLSLPASLEVICNDYFGYNLPETSGNIYVSPENKAYTVDENGVLFNKDKTVLIKFPVNTYAKDSYTVPEGVLSISGEAFKNAKLKQIIIPETVTTIGQSAIRSCQLLEQIVIPSSVISLEGQAFFECIALKTVTFAEGSRLEKIGTSVFERAIQLETITIPASVKKIDDGAFGKCDVLEEVVFEENSKLEILGEGVFDRCISLKSFKAPNGIIELGWDVFRECLSLESADFGSELKNISITAFYNCPALSQIKISEDNEVFTVDEYGVIYNKDKTKIIRCAPANPKLIDYMIPDTVTEIASYAFEGCNVFREISIPEGIKFVGACAFENCKGLTKVDYEAIKCFVFGEMIATQGSIAVFSGCENLTEINIASNVEYIPDTAFCGFYSMEYIVIPVSVERFGYYFVEPRTEIRYCGHEWEWNLIDKYDMDYSQYTVIFNYGKTPVVRTDSSSGVIVEGLYAEDYDGDVTLEAKECNKEEANIVLDSSFFLSRKKQLYDISLICNGETVQPGGTVTVHIPKPQGFREKYTHLYYVNPETNENTEIEYTVSGNYIIFTIDHFSYYALVEDFSISIVNNPGTATVDYGESLRLTAEHNGTNGETVYWYLDGVLAGKGDTVTVTPDSAGSEVSAVLCDKDGKEIADADGNPVSDSQKITVNAGFFKRIISFFKNLFRLDRTVVQ